MTDCGAHALYVSAMFVRWENCFSDESTEMSDAQAEPAKGLSKHS